MVVDLCYAQVVHSAVHNTLFTLLLQARSAAAKLMLLRSGVARQASTRRPAQGAGPLQGAWSSGGLP